MFSRLLKKDEFVIASSRPGFAVARPGERSDPGPPQPGRAKQSWVSYGEIRDCPAPESPPGEAGASLPLVARNDTFLFFSSLLGHREN